ncbi:MAG: hypothetical protein ACOC43_10000 [Desulfohalobiaceae bacterium]
MRVKVGYETLARVLQDALDQAQMGKGLRRHAAGEPFSQQEICANTRAVGLGYPLGQARKKAREAKRLFETEGLDPAVAECLGAINYLAAAVLVMREAGVSVDTLPDHTCTQEEDEKLMSKYMYSRMQNDGK